MAATATIRLGPSGRGALGASFPPCWSCCRRVPLRGLRCRGGHVPEPREDAISALFYYANWHFIGVGSNYFSQTAPDLSADPYLVARRRRAVLFGLAACRPRRLQDVEEHTGLAHRVRHRCSGVIDRDGGALLPRRRQPPVLRHRHPRPVPARRRRTRGVALVVGRPPPPVRNGPGRE